MDVAHPIRSVIPTLDGPVLIALARTTRPLTGREVHRLCRAGSEGGVRGALERLVNQGVVWASRRGASTFYEGNREHISWPAVELLAQLRSELLSRLRAEIGSWELKPLHASLYGSAARADGTMESDIDVLLIRADDLDADARWEEQVDQLRRRVELWTGNPCHPIDMSPSRLAHHLSARDRLVDEWLHDGVTLAGDGLPDVIRRVRTMDLP